VTSQTDVVVVGGGLAGLSAAVILHRAGLTVIVCEAGDQVGGRVRTDRRDGFLLDRGFQVVLPGYPELRRSASGWPAVLARAAAAHLAWSRYLMAPSVCGAAVRRHSGNSPR
jgi:phytoene dehydrogenase-like protein